MNKNTGIIILDGPDATGKTTLQEFFVSEYNAIPIHLTWTKELAPRMFDYQTEKMLEAIELSSTNLVIVDRHWISEKIYGNVLRGGSPWPLMGKMMDRIWRKHAALYVITLPVQSKLGFEMAVSRHRDNIDDKHPYGDAQFMQLLIQYSEFYNANFTRHDMIPYMIEFEGCNLKSFCERALSRLSYLQDAQYKPALLPANQNICGHLSKANFLFIGERVNRKDNIFAWPFYEYRNTSLFFAEVLNEIFIDETRFMWTNAYDEFNNYNVMINDLLIKHGLTPIVLGNEALDALHKHGFKHLTSIMHPSYAKRFNKREEFKAAIRSSLQLRCV